jgi:hypothetical protein
MSIQAVIFGSTGMIGKGLLLECLDSADVKSVLVINRQAGGIKHAKLKEIIHKNFMDLSPLAAELANYNTCYFCLGVTSAGLPEEEYNKITFDLTVSVANDLLKINREIAFCYLSGAGTDSTEKGKMMWARVKGRTENALLAMPFKKAYMFRPGYIQPKRGIRSRTRLYNIMYAIFTPLYYVLRPFKGLVTDTGSLGRAMIRAVASGYGKQILEVKDINALAGIQSTK